MNPVSVSPSITSYEATRAPSSFEDGSRFIKKRFSSAPSILAPAYDAFLERFLTEMTLYIEEANRHTSKNQIVLFLYVIHLVSCRTAANQKTLDPNVYSHIQDLVLDSLSPLCKKVVALQASLNPLYCNLVPLSRLKGNDPILFNHLMEKFYVYMEARIKDLIDFIPSLQAYRRQKSLPLVASNILAPIYQEVLFSNLGHRSDKITQEKQLADIYFNWAVTLLTILETPTEHSAYALKAIFSESLDLFLRFSFLDFYKLIKDPNIDCRDLEVLPEPLKNHRWKDFFTTMGLPTQSVLASMKPTYTWATRYRVSVLRRDSKSSKYRFNQKISKIINRHASSIREDFQKYIAIYLFSLQTFDSTTIKSIDNLPKVSHYLIEKVKKIEKEGAKSPSIPFDHKDKETLRSLITSLGVFLSLQDYPFLLPDLLHLLYWLDEEGFSTRHYPFLLHAFHRIAEYAILDSLQKWFSRRNPDSSNNIEDYFPYLIDNLRRPDLADRIGALILKEDLDYFIHPEARTGAKEIMEAVHLSNLELPPEECEKVASRFIEQIKPLLDLLIELIDQLNRYKPSIRNHNLDRFEKMFPSLTKELE